MTSDESDQAAAENLPEVCPPAGVPEPSAAAVEEESERQSAELAALRDRHLRLQAEFENYRKRQQRGREELNRQAKERMVAELPAVLDNLERALRHAGDAEADPGSLVQGVELVCRQLQEILARFGVEPIVALGAPFDPHLHEAMARVDTDGDPADGTVVEEFRRGYLVDGKVLRPSLVAVAKIADTGTDADGEDSS